MGGMLGSYIATVTASSAVNFHFLPPAIRWLWPSLLGVPASRQLITLAAESMARNRRLKGGWKAVQTAGSISD